MQSKAVRLGEWDLDTDDDCEEDHCSDPPVNIPIGEIIVHEGYKPYSKNREHDIALIRLSQAVNYTKWIKPLCLPTTSTLRATDYGSETTFTVAGWGAVCSILFLMFTMVYNKTFQENFE